MTSPQQPNFAHTWNGYDRTEVDAHLERLQGNMQQLISDRDKAIAQHKNLAKQVEHLRAENAKLKGRVDELLEPPEKLEDLDVRMQRVGKLAHIRAEEMTSRAQTATEENWKATAKASIALRERYRSLLKELDKHAEQLHAEHRAALEETRAEVKELMVDAVRRRDALDAEAERKRRAIEREFDATMAAQKKELEKHIADQRSAAKQAAERRIAEAAAAARRTIAEANSQAERRTKEANTVIDRLLSITKDAHGRLDSADKVLAKAEKDIEPTAEEQKPVPRAEDAVPGPESTDSSSDKTQPSRKPTGQKSSPNGQSGDQPAPQPRKPAAKANASR